MVCILYEIHYGLIHGIFLLYSYFSISISYLSFSSTHLIYYFCACSSNEDVSPS